MQPRKVSGSESVQRTQPSQHGPSPRCRRPQNLTLILPQRELLSLAVPVPLLPPSSSSPAPALDDLDRIRRVGSGAGGTVWLTRHRNTSRLYALKVIHGQHDDDVCRQIRREIEILHDADNPFLVHCYGFYNRGGEIQILLEYMDGGSLEGRGFSSEVQLAGIARQVLSGLSYLHHRRIVHRDIKPSNLLINSHGVVKIADFGVGQILDRTMDTCKSAVGTIAYMSPERINTDLNDGTYDGRAGDIWSFGMSILEFSLGRFPFGERLGMQGDWVSLMMEICYGALPKAPSTASPEFHSFVSSCLQRESVKRPTAEQLLLHPFLAQALPDV